MQTKKATLSEGTWQQDRDQLMKWVRPHLGNRPVAQIEASELLSVLRRLEKKGVIDTAHRVCTVCGRDCRCAIATGRAPRDVSADRSLSRTDTPATWARWDSRPFRPGRRLSQARTLGPRRTRARSGEDGALRVREDASWSLKGPCTGAAAR